MDDWNLDALRWHWDSAYLIDLLAPGAWVAQRRDNRDTLRAGSARELADKIRADYLTSPVSVRVDRGLQGGAYSDRFRPGAD